MIYETLLGWIFDSIMTLGDVGQWLITPLDYINMSPLAVLSLGGISFLLGVHLIKLFL